jgi:hypothetical protein
MNPLMIEGTAKTPAIAFAADGTTLTISGRSIPENTAAFFQPVFDWLDAFAQQPPAQATLKVQLEYFNTSSSKCLLDIFRKLEGVQQSGKGKVSVEWAFEEEDEDMMEAGEDYRSLVALPFDLKKV